MDVVTVSYFADWSVGAAPQRQKRLMFEDQPCRVSAGPSLSILNVSMTLTIYILDFCSKANTRVIGDAGYQHFVAAVWQSPTLPLPLPQVFCYLSGFRLSVSLQHSEAVLSVTEIFPSRQCSSDLSACGEPGEPASANTSRCAESRQEYNAWGCCSRTDYSTAAPLNSVVVGFFFFNFSIKLPQKTGIKLFQSHTHTLMENNAISFQ